MGLVPDFNGKEHRHPVDLGLLGPPQYPQYGALYDKQRGAV